MNKHNIEDEALTGDDRILADELKHTFIEKAGYVSDRRIKAILETYVRNAVKVCKEFNISAAAYVAAVLAFQAPPNNQPSFMPWQLAPTGARTYVQDYLATCGPPNIPGLFKAQCRILGIALSNHIKDYVCLSDGANDFYPWFRVLMTAVPNLDIINKYGKEAYAQIKHNVELEVFLKNVECGD